MLSIIRVLIAVFIAMILTISAICAREKRRIFLFHVYIFFAFIVIVVNLYTSLQYKIEKFRVEYMNRNSIIMEELTSDTNKYEWDIID